MVMSMRALAPLRSAFREWLPPGTPLGSAVRAFTEVLVRARYGASGVPLECNGTAMRVHPGDRGLYASVFEPEVDARLTRLLRPGATFIDVGGYVGLHGLRARHLVREDGVVVLFEPDRIILPVLHRTLGLNPWAANITVEPIAVGREVGSLAFHALGNSGSHGGRSQAAAQTYQVAMTTLDHYCEAHALLPDVVLIDVEGAEGEVLSGMRRLWRRHPGMVAIVEMHPAFWGRCGTDASTMKHLIIEELALEVDVLTPTADPFSDYSHVEVRPTLAT
jgi:FkbM family methyltransferase